MISLLSFNHTGSLNVNAIRNLTMTVSNLIIDELDKSQGSLAGTIVQLVGNDTHQVIYLLVSRSSLYMKFIRL